MRFSTSAILSFLASLSAASQGPQKDACGQIHDLSLQQSSDESSFSVPGELAHQCLQSMPFDPTPPVSFVKEYAKYLEFQSTLETLKNPPAGYKMPGTDLVGGLSKIQEKAAASGYASQYKFDSDLQHLLNTAYDGHLSLDLCSLDFFSFENKVPLVSISSNGIDLPQVYAADDVFLLSSNPDRVSPVVSVNGVEVERYLQKVGSQMSYQDMDAQYNVNFYSKPYSVSQTGKSDGIFGVFTTSIIWPGPSQVLGFANGTTKTYDTVAKFSEQFRWENGTAFYEHQCLPSEGMVASILVLGAEPLEAPSGYPEPFNRDRYNRILGFFPDHPSLKDVAVLSVPSFETQGSLNGRNMPASESRYFSNIARDLILNATAMGKKRMIIDLSGNPGGSVYAGVNLFRQFFPDKEARLAQRFRTHESLDLLGQAVSSLLEGPGTELEGMPPFDWTSTVHPDQKTAFNLFAPKFDKVSEADYPINGYGTAGIDPVRESFAPKDIIMITDGTCSSTCTIFIELMKGQGVRTIAFGGRPQQGPMQGMGGVKGSMVLSFQSLNWILSTGAQAMQLLGYDFAQRWKSVMPTPIRQLPLISAGGSVNFINAFGPNNDQVPLQFVYEAAECRLFYTAENILYVETTWAAAADAMFHGGPCVPQSTKWPGSLDYSEPTKGSFVSLIARIVKEYIHPRK